MSNQGLGWKEAEVVKKSSNSSAFAFTHPGKNAKINQYGSTGLSLAERPRHTRHSFYRSS